MAEIVCCAGLTPREVRDDLTWPDYLDLLDYWRKWPPPNVSAALAAGLGPQQRGAGETTPTDAPPEDLAQLYAFLGPPPEPAL